MELWAQNNICAWSGNVPELNMQMQLVCHLSMMQMPRWKTTMMRKQNQKLQTTMRWLMMESNNLHLCWNCLKMLRNNMLLQFSVRMWETRHKCNLLFWPCWPVTVCWMSTKKRQQTYFYDWQSVQEQTGCRHLCTMAGWRRNSETVEAEINFSQWNFLEVRIQRWAVKFGWRKSAAASGAETSWCWGGVRVNFARTHGWHSTNLDEKCNEFFTSLACELHDHVVRFLVLEKSPFPLAFTKCRAWVYKMGCLETLN